MDIKSFTNWGGPGGIIHSEKWENHKNSCDSIILVIFSFFWMDKAPCPSHGLPQFVKLLIQSYKKNIKWKLCGILF